VIKLVDRVGQHFQIRDDYQNLQSAEYAAQKGFCEDLDEGKLSFPLIHCLHQANSPIQLREVLRARQNGNAMSIELKSLVLEQLEKSGSLAYTRQTLQRLQREIEVYIDKIEQSTDCENWILRLLLQKLSL
jgi:geranylgeranyl pyrophosphate synthase